MEAGTKCETRITSGEPAEGSGSYSSYNMAALLIRDTAPRDYSATLPEVTSAEAGSALDMGKTTNAETRAPQHAVSSSRTQRGRASPPLAAGKDACWAVACSMQILR